MSDRKKIIVIDDDPDIITYLTTLLDDNGYDSVTAVNGVDGLAKTKAERPDLILLDITMPEKSGVRYYRDVREDPDLKSIPVVMVTGVMKQFEKFISTRRQVPPPDGYISKPIDEKKLLDTIAKLLAG
jgi:CheY-like chemotaxis protein